MCKQGDTSQMLITDKSGNKKLIDVDNCIFGLVKALNDNGFHTKACCCGHGAHSGNIALMDGRELIIAKDYETARKFDNM